MADASPLMLWIWRNRPSILRRNEALSRAGSRSVALIILNATSESSRNDDSWFGSTCRIERNASIWRLRDVLRTLELRGQGDARGDVGHGHQHVRDRAFAAHAVEVELEVAGLGVLAALLADQRVPLR